MALGEEDVRRLADLKLKIEDKMRSLEEELDLLKEMSQVVDALLKRISFARASQVPPPEEGVREEAEAIVRPLRRTKDGLPLATAKIYDDRTVIEVNPDLSLKASIPPFRSFFLNRVLGEMMRKDEEERKMKPINYEVKEDEDGILKGMVIRNPGDSSRVNEILNILTWTFTKMLEKIERVRE